MELLLLPFRVLHRLLTIPGHSDREVQHLRSIWSSSPQILTLMQSLEDDEYIAQKLCILLCLDKCRQIKSHNEVVSFHLFFKLIYSLKGRYFSGIPSNLYDSVIFL